MRLILVALTGLSSASGFDALPSFAESVSYAREVQPGSARKLQLACGNEMPTLLGIDRREADAHTESLLQGYFSYYRRRQVSR